MNVLAIREPRWRDRTVLLADWKLGEDNMVIIDHRNYPEPFYISGAQARQYPLESKKSKNGKEFFVRIVPINDLVPMVEELDD